MADLTINAAAVAASNQATIRREYPFGATITAGQLVYLDSNLRWQPFDSDASTGANVTDVRGIALNNGANTQPASVAIADPNFAPGATLTNGVTYYGSVTAGAIATDVPNSGRFPVFVGVARSTTRLNLNPTAAGVAV
jgi:hypothetical protein